MVASAEERVVISLYGLLILSLAAGVIIALFIITAFQEHRRLYQRYRQWDDDVKLLLYWLGKT